MKKLLIVEDDINTLNGLIELFREEGFWVFGERRMRDAMRSAKDYNVDILLTDYRLPDGDGLDLSSNLKKINPNMTCYLVTAWLSVDLHTVATQCGVRQIFYKPVAIDHLLEVISAGAKKTMTPHYKTQPKKLTAYAM